MSSGQNFGGVLAYRLVALFAMYFASYYTVWEALIVPLPGESATPIRLRMAVAADASRDPLSRTPRSSGVIG